jgi:amino acid transporter
MNEREMTSEDKHGFAEQEQHDASAGPAGGGGDRLNPDLTVSLKKAGTRPGDAYVRTARPYHRLFRGRKGRLVATAESYRPETMVGKIGQRLKSTFIGRPLFSQDEVHERLTKTKALAVFGSDAISSCAYATEASLLMLVVAGSGALHFTFYIALGIAILLSIVAFSYRQIVHAYPQGGGAYNVSRTNMGRIFGLIAASALLVDYVMTVAVSIAAGAFAVSSALIASGNSAFITGIESYLPPIVNFNVVLSLIFMGLIVLGNLRGIRESGSIFSIPTYLFIFGFGAMLVIGMFKALTNTLVPADPVAIIPMAQPITLWLLLRAFSAGAVAMSGTEAIANGVPVFAPPESRNAAATISIMATLLGLFFVGVSYLATHMGLVPGDQSIVSQVALAVFGRNVFYYGFQILTMAILVVAANTAFAGFPRLSSVLARDNFMPHSFGQRGDRLAFSTGIVFLGGLSAFLLIVFRGNVDSLIHLYAVGVFLAFSLSNSGMVFHWIKTRGRGWKSSLAINAAGAILTLLVLLVVVVTKFALGAWMVVVLIPAIIPFFLAVRRHYDRVGAQLRIQPDKLPPPTFRQFVVVPIDDVNNASLRAMSFARTVCQDIFVLHIASDPVRSQNVQTKMNTYAPDLKFVVVETPLRSIMPPLLAYVEALHNQHANAFISIVLPEFVTARWWERFLHNRTADQLTRAFKKHPNIAVILVPYLLRR